MGGWMDGWMDGGWTDINKYTLTVMIPSSLLRPVLPTGESSTFTSPDDLGVEEVTLKVGVVTGGGAIAIIFTKPFDKLLTTFSA
jgi:hypothetical protein